MMKCNFKTMAIFLALCLITISFVACGSKSEQNADTITEAVVETDTEETAEMDTEEITGDNTEQVANPWSTVDSLEAAAEGAGIDAFTLADGMEISLGPVKPTEYRCMDGLAEVYVLFPAVDMTIRKGKSELAGEGGDISGDYNQYKHSWTQNVKGLEVNCYGNRKGEATKTIWQVDDYCYSITAYGLGGDDDYGLSEDDINTIINGIQ